MISLPVQCVHQFRTQSIVCFFWWCKSPGEGVHLDTQEKEVAKHFECAWWVFKANIYKLGPSFSFCLVSFFFFPKVELHGTEITHTDVAGEVMWLRLGLGFVCFICWKSVYSLCFHGQRPWRTVLPERSIHGLPPQTVSFVLIQPFSIPPPKKCQYTLNSQQFDDKWSLHLSH